MRPYEAIDAVRDWFGNGQFSRETSCFAADGMGIIAMSTQDRMGLVNFDFFRIWGAMKAAHRMPRMAWMYHTHPPSAGEMSSTDENAIKGWVAGLGMPIEMVVISGRGAHHYRCKKGHVVDDMGYPMDMSPDEEFLSAVMCGLSRSEHPCLQEELDRISIEVHGRIPVKFWDFFEYG